MFAGLLSPLLLLPPILLAILSTPWHSEHALRIVSPSLPSKPERVLLLIAHPDDESFFFGPTLTALTGRQNALADDTTETELYVLSLSTGNADGQGERRKGELWNSLDVFGIDSSRRWIVDHPGLQDNFTATWDASLIAETVEPYVVDNEITTILTFDPRGVSSHPNHLSLFFGTSRLLTSQPSLRAHALITVPVSTKYVGILAPVLAKLDLATPRILTYLGYGHLGGVPVPAFVAGVREYWTAHRALRQHTSQLVWFRWLYLSFSRYMWVNEWVAIPPGLAMRRAT